MSEIYFFNGDLTVMSKMRYCINVIRHNQHRFLDFEKRYYQGKCEKVKPHGIENFYWRKAWKIANR
jgi:hypothetical protein